MIDRLALHHDQIANAFSLGMLLSGGTPLFGVVGLHRLYDQVIEILPLSWLDRFDVIA